MAWETWEENKQRKFRKRKLTKLDKTDRWVERQTEDQWVSDRTLLTRQLH